jgi:CheY-like chemotaxis protein
MDEERSAVLETLRISANRGAEMVKQVLTFARGMEGQRIEIRPSLVLKEIEHLVRETFPRNIAIAMSEQARMPAVLGDPTQLHQVVLNLCLNARDAMPGGGKLGIAASTVRYTSPQRSATGEIPPGDYVRIEVEDTGCGIGDAALERIFEPFFTTKAHGEGTGLGLSTTLTIVQKHAGYIHVRSTIGQGTCFTVLLPAVISATQPSSSPSRPADIPGGTGETVMVVDDDDPVREIAARTLGRAGYKVVTARDGKDALARWRAAGNVSLVLTDLMMPVMDGEELVRELRRIDPGVRVLCSSGLASQASAPQGERFLPKPYSEEMLLASVRESLAA